MWQGIMLCALPAAWWGMLYKDGAYMRWAVGAYAALGVALLVVIVRA